MMSQSLAGTNVLVTRVLHQAAEFVQKIKDAGGTPVVFPTIEIRPVTDWGPCDKAIGVLHMYDGLLFTSANAVEYFFRRYRDNNHQTGELGKKQIFAVGEKTKLSLEKEGIAVTGIPEKFTSADLSTMLAAEDLHGKVFLFPGGNLTKETLPDNLRILGANVDLVPVYSTVVPDKGDLDALHGRFMRHEIDIMTFLSPSAFKNFVVLFSIERTREYVESAAIAAIGPATAEVIRQHGISVDIIPRTATVDVLVEAMGAYIARQGVSK